MFIRRREYERLLERIERLENDSRAHWRRTTVFVNEDGSLDCGWDGNSPLLITVLNVMSKHLGIKWNIAYAKPSTLEIKKE